MRRAHDGLRAGRVFGRALCMAAMVLLPAGVRAQDTTLAKASTAANEPLDVAGLRVGVKAKEMEGAMTRLFGKVSRQERGTNWFRGYRAALVVNDMGCQEMPGARRAPQPGTVCVTAFLDDGDVVRGIRVERLFPFVDAETFRATMVRKYGAVTEGKQGGGYVLGWGATIDPTLVYDTSGPHTALSAHYETSDDFMSRGLNAAPKIRVVLNLVDATWAASHAK